MVCLGTTSIALADPWAIIWGRPCQLKRGADVPLLMLSVTAPTANHNSRRSSGLCPPTSFFLFTVLDGSSGRGGESSSLWRAACGEDERVAAAVCARRWRALGRALSTLADRHMSAPACRLPKLRAPVRAP